MDPAIHQSLAFVLLLIIGLLLKFKIKDPSELKGIKKLILCVALPATIFVALLKIELDASLILLPILAIGMNVSMFLLAKYLLIPWLFKNELEERKRSMLLLFASLAPGLSCLPFIMEYLGDQPLAMAALADVGNKIFVLIILYLVAMQWYYRKKEIKNDQNSTQDRVKDLLLSLIKEPVNMVIVLALILIGLGLKFEELPLFVRELVSRTHALTTGMVLIFIGAAIRIQKGEIKAIFSVLLLRSGFAFLMSAALLSWFGGQWLASAAMILVVFPQSSVSFWPFAHMSAIESLEQKDKASKSTFDLQFALNMLACSLPFSSILILGLCSFGETLANPIFCLIAACITLSLGFFLSLNPIKDISNTMPVKVKKKAVELEKV